MAIEDKAAGADDSEWNPEWIRPWPEWRQALLDYRAMRAAMTPEEEQAYLESADEEIDRRIAEAKRRAAQRGRAVAVGAGTGGGYPMYADGNRG